MTDRCTLRPIKCAEYLGGGVIVLALAQRFSIVGYAFFILRSASLGMRYRYARHSWMLFAEQGRIALMLDVHSNQ